MLQREVFIELTTGWKCIVSNSVSYKIIFRRRCAKPAHLLLREKSGVSRVGTDSNIPSLPVIQWNSYGGIWKWVTILSILVGMVQLLSVICCISSYVHQQLHSLDCQHFVHYNSLILFTYLRTPHGAGFHFWRWQFVRVQYVHSKVHWKIFHPFYPPPFPPLILSPVQNLKGQCHEIFDFWFFSWISFPQAPKYTITAISNFFENSWRYSRLKVHHRCHWRRWQM